MADPRIIVALDYANERDALKIAAKLSPEWCRLKVGKELFTAAGPRLIDKLSHRGFEVFLDLKFHDIPNTVRKACLAAIRLNVWMLNVHALGGRDMMIAAREAVSGSNTRLIAVTLLTSLGQNDLETLGIYQSPQRYVQRLALLVHECGLDGVVCSAQEAQSLRQLITKKFILVTPGIRPMDCSGDDQQRITTPAQAVKNGANYLVIGRPITLAQDPAQVLERIVSELDSLHAG